MHGRRSDCDNERIVKSCFILIDFILNFAHVNINHFTFSLQDKSNEFSSINFFNFMIKLIKEDKYDQDEWNERRDGY